MLASAINDENYCNEEGSVIVKVPQQVKILISLLLVMVRGQPTLRVVHLRAVTHFMALKNGLVHNFPVAKKKPQVLRIHIQRLVPILFVIYKTNSKQLFSLLGNFLPIDAFLVSIKTEIHVFYCLISCDGNFEATFIITGMQSNEFQRASTFWWEFVPAFQFCCGAVPFSKLSQS